MKNERGITLIALIIYIILMTFVVAGVSSITASFYGNLNEMDKSSESAVSFAKFNMYFINDIKSENVKIVSSGTNYIELSLKNKSGDTQTVKYSIQNDTLYRDKIKICDKIKDSKITANQEGKKVTVDIYLKIDNYEKTTSYVLEPKNSNSGAIIVRIK